MLLNKITEKVDFWIPQSKPLLHIDVGGQIFFLHPFFPPYIDKIVYCLYFIKEK